MRQFVLKTHNKTFKLEIIRIIASSEQYQRQAAHFRFLCRLISRKTFPLCCSRLSLYAPCTTFYSHSWTVNFWLFSILSFQRNGIYVLISMATWERSRNDHFRAMRCVQTLSQGYTSKATAKLMNANKRLLLVWNCRHRSSEAHTGAYKQTFRSRDSEACVICWDFVWTPALCLVKE